MEARQGGDGLPGSVYDSRPGSRQGRSPAVMASDPVRQQANLKDDTATATIIRSVRSSEVIHSREITKREDHKRAVIPQA